MPHYWLIKSEPDVYSIRDLERDGSTEAIDRTYRALREFHIGPIKTTIPLHRQLMRNAAFREGGIDIHFLERRRQQRDDRSDSRAGGHRPARRHLSPLRLHRYDRDRPLRLDGLQGAPALRDLP